MGKTYRLSKKVIPQVKVAYERWYRTYAELGKAAGSTRQLASNYLAGKDVRKKDFVDFSTVLGFDWENLVEWEERMQELQEDICQGNHQQGATQSQAIIVTDGELLEHNRIEINNKIVTVELIISNLNTNYDLKLTLELTEKGSVKITVGGSPEDLEKLQELFRAGELKEVLGIPIEDIQIVSQRVEGQNLNNPNLSSINAREPSSQPSAGYLGDSTIRDVTANQDSPSRNSQASYRNRGQISRNVDVRILVFCATLLLCWCVAIFMLVKQGRNPFSEAAKSIEYYFFPSSTKTSPNRNKLPNQKKPYLSSLNALKG